MPSIIIDLIMNIIVKSKYIVIVASAICLGLILPAQKFLFFNFSESIPPGLYRLSDSKFPLAEELVLVDVSPSISEKIQALSSKKPETLMKPVAAISGDTVCREPNAIFLPGAGKRFPIKAHILAEFDEQKTGCRRLGRDEYFLLSNHRDSLDSRYFGPISLDSVRGKLTSFLLFSQEEKI